jgi:membrane-associated protease RseP (regulator of RpoE activity)
MDSTEQFSPPLAPAPRDRSALRIWLHVGLFALALITCTLSGAELVTGLSWWVGNDEVRQLAWPDLALGLPYAVSFLGFLTAHEFGHYFVARRNGVRSSLPYYIPLYLPFMPFNIGSMGAVIRLHDRPDSTQKYFDIGIAGPLAGVVISVLLLVIGFLTLPDPQYLANIHPDYSQFGGSMPSDGEIERLMAGNANLAIGDNLLYRFLAWAFANPAYLPGKYEMYHYPLLFAGYITLFFTALNLLPIGQLDGGHVLYGLLGRKRAGLVSRVAVFAMILYGGVGLINPNDKLWAVQLGFYLLYLAYLLPQLLGTSQWWVLLSAMMAVLVLQVALAHVLPDSSGHLMWLIYAFMAIRLIGLDHPPAAIEAPLDRRRQILGWLALVLFVLCFTPEPISYVQIEAPQGVFVQR